MNRDLISWQALAQRLLNRTLRLDPEALRRIGELEGKAILLELAAAGAPLRVYVLPQPRGLQLLRDYDRPPDVTISGTVSIFLGQLARGPSLSDALTIRGDIELGQRFQRAMAGLDPDWEGELARFVGDVPAHQFARAGRAARAWLGRAVRTLGRDGAEYLTEEAMIVARRERVAEFMREVDRLRADTDRLEKRLQHLTAAL